MRASPVLYRSIPRNLLTNKTLTVISPSVIKFRQTGNNPTRCTFKRNPSRTASFSALPVADEALMGFVSGKRKATEVAHLVWKNVVRKNDIVVDATCGNGYDTLALLKMISDESGDGCVYGMDIQSTSIESTSFLLKGSANENERKLVKLSVLCHSKMEEFIPKDTLVRLVAFNLGYLPGGDKTIVTKSHTTLMALQAASRIVESGGLISVLVYVGHPGGRDEYETVQSFASSLPIDGWATSKLEMINRPSCPVLVFIHKSSTRCAACKCLRRRCTLECILAPHFPTSDPERFSNVHRVFGAGNVGRILQQLPMNLRREAANSIAIEAMYRVNNPIYGCLQEITSLQEQIKVVQCELAATQAQIALLTSYCLNE